MIIARENAPIVDVVNDVKLCLFLLKELKKNHT